MSVKLSDSLSGRHLNQDVAISSGPFVPFCQSPEIELNESLNEQWFLKNDIVPLRAKYRLLLLIYYLEEKKS